MFRAEQQNQFIPSKSVAIKPENVATVFQNDEIRFHVPSFVGFIDPTNSYLKFNLKFKDARGKIVPDARAGGSHALFRQLIIRDGSNQTSLEVCEEYGAKRALLNQFTRNTGLKDELFEGVQSVEGTNAQDKTLYYKSVPQITAVAPALDVPVHEGHDVMVQMPLDCGLFRGGNVIPSGLMNGLRIQLQTDSLQRSCVITDMFGEKTHGDLGRVFLKVDAHAQNTETRVAEAGLPLTIGGATAFSDGYQCRVNIGRDFNPFAVGDILYVSNNDAPHTNEEALGVVLGFNTYGVNLLTIVYNPLRNRNAGLDFDHAIDSIVYYKVADREVAGTFHTLANNVAGNDLRSGSYNAPSYEMSELEFIVQSVTPPESYVNGMMEASTSSSGISFDIMSYQLFRHNQSNLSGLVQAQMPVTMTRAKALFCQPLSTATARARSIGAHSLSGIVDGGQTYEFIHGTQHYPSRLAPIKRYNVRLAGKETRVEALHVSELQKALVNVDERVLSLQRIADNFVVARSLSKFAQVMDLSKETTSVRVDYLNGTEQKILYLYAFGLKRIMINSQGVSTMV